MNDTTVPVSPAKHRVNALSTFVIYGLSAAYGLGFAWGVAYLLMGANIIPLGPTVTITSFICWSTIPILGLLTLHLGTRANFFKELHLVTIAVYAFGCFFFLAFGIAMSSTVSRDVLLHEIAFQRADDSDVISEYSQHMESLLEPSRMPRKPNRTGGDEVAEPMKAQTGWKVVITCTKDSNVNETIDLLTNWTSTSEREAIEADLRDAARDRGFLLLRGKTKDLYLNVNQISSVSFIPAHGDPIATSEKPWLSRPGNSIVQPTQDQKP